MPEAGLVSADGDVRRILCGGPAGDNGAKIPDHPSEIRIIRKTVDFSAVSEDNGYANDLIGSVDRYRGA